MSRSFEVSFNSPQCGWMSIGFDDGERDFHTTTAHAPHAGALGELMQILTALADPAKAEQEHILQWNRDPEEFDFRFMRSGDSVRFEIYEYPTGERADGERELVYTHEGPADEIVDAFGVTFKQLYEDRGTDEFEFNWRQPFPYAEYEQFNARKNA